MPKSLSTLSELLKRDQEILAYPKREWVHPRTTSTGQNIYDSLIIGGGQSGLGIANGLLLEKVNNILVVDENPSGLEGPWLRYARMPQLRTPKYLSGLDFGNPNLTFRAFYVAKFDQEAYDKLAFIPTALWAEYLAWYREERAIPVRNQTKAHAIHHNPSENCLAIALQSPQEEGIIFARTVVLANGIDGCGAWQAPKIITDNIPRERYAHTSEAIDFAALKNLRVGVIGAGASAFDNAIFALNAGARSLHLFSRRHHTPYVNPYRWAEFVGFLKHHGDLDDLMRWRFIARIIEMGQLPPKATIDHARAKEYFHLETGQNWLSVSLTNEEICVQTEKESFQFDFIIVGTGLVTDLTMRPELSRVSEYIARWSDRFNPPPELAHDDLSRHPYLGPHYELQERQSGTAPYLSSIFCYNFGTLLSLGLSGGSISGLKYSLPKLVAGITRKLFIDDSEHHFNDLMNYAVPEYDLMVDS